MIKKLILIILFCLLPDSAFAAYGNTGGTITDDGDYKVHTFTSSGTFTACASGNVAVLVVAGGGGGAGTTYGGGGGGGGVCEIGATYAVTAQGYTVTVGAGAGQVGAGSNGEQGSDSVFNDITAVGGGGGGTYTTAGVNGGCGGGSGGNGSASASTAGGTATQGASGGATGYGYNGGAKGNNISRAAGGGGGTGAVGESSSIDDNGGDGGGGHNSSISGASTDYAGGGGGGSYYGPIGLGADGGGDGGQGDPTNSPTAATANTGSGGGGSGTSGNGQSGGSGIVIVRALAADFEPSRRIIMISKIKDFFTVKLAHADVPRYFAEIKNNIVLRVIVADSKEWCEKHLGGEWIETYMDKKNYAGIGYTYDPVKDNFIAPKRYNSWILDNDCKWQPPVLKPEGPYEWNEKKLKWENVNDLSSM
uniref:Putative structural protein n=1 Tax=viral metagenome TaxID=1070528 RepID=A0A6M3IYS7_9ZZZZ